jgi:glycerol-3-phosphate dehydrogenase (NAD(P)+)
VAPWPESPRVAVIGAGAWGTALAELVARKGLRVALWARSADVFEALRHGENTVYLPGHRLSEAIAPTRAIDEALRGAHVVVLAVPSHAMRQVATGLAPYLEAGAVAVSVAKGVEESSLKFMTQVLREVLGETIPLAALSGPSFAIEVARGLPTAVTVASTDLACAHHLQRLFATPAFRVYASRDVVGVELGGATKNVIAIAAGIADGLGFGHNTRAALITRGLAEMARLGARLGANPATFAGLAGLGDLVLTCTGDLSRNRSLGLGLGRGATLADLTGGRQVAEGVRTALSLHGLAERLGVDTPICEQVWRVLYEAKAPREAVAELMARDLKDEAV